MPTAIDVEALILAIAEKFAEHRMNEHLEGLRAYYRARRRRRLQRVRLKRPPWDEDLVLHWAALWRIPPLENVYPQLPRPYCPCPRASESNSFTSATFPEGTLMHCQACNTTWLVLRRQ